MGSPDTQLTEQIWDSLKIVIMIIAVLAPVAIVFLSIRYNRIIKGLKMKDETNQRIIEKRIEIYDRLGPKLNDILNFFSYTGNWKEISPPDIIRLKKELDKELNISMPLFSDDLSKKYNAFIQACFVSFSGWEHKEKIKSLYEIRKEHNIEWDEDWIQYFDTNNVLEAIKLKERYNELMAHFKKDLSL